MNPDRDHFNPSFDDFSESNSFYFPNEGHLSDDEFLERYEMQEAMLEQHMEDAMLEQYMEDAMLEHYMEDEMLEQQMEDEMLEQQMEDEMLVAQYGSAPDSKKDSWIAVHDDYTTTTIDDINNYSCSNILFFINKIYMRSSDSGKTSYYNYKILNPDKISSNLIIGKYYCNEINPEYWASWNYSNDDEIEVNHYNKSIDDNKLHGNRLFYYPIGYNFASIIMLNHFNPLYFNFSRLNFLKKNDKVSCGDKLNHVKIVDSDNKYMHILMFDFENNIIPLLKELNESESFVDYKINSLLKYAIDIFQSIVSGNELFILIKESLKGTKFEDPNSSYHRKKAFEDICEFIERNNSDYEIYIPKRVRNYQNSNYNSLLQQYFSLKGKLQEMLNF